MIHRPLFRLSPIIVGVLIGLFSLVLVAVHVRAARSNIRALNRNCADEAASFGSEADNLAAGSKVVRYTSHYNLERHRCFVDITSIHPDDGAMSSTEQIVDPDDWTFIASCERRVGARHEYHHTGRPNSYPEG
jgi:hypothetical protein